LQRVCNLGLAPPRDDLAHPLAREVGGAAGVPLEAIGDFIRHASTYMVERYRHLLPDSHDDAREKLDALLASSS
jgi:hypothetical protein